jgi:hypothetical protein
MTASSASAHPQTTSEVLVRVVRSDLGDAF